MVIHTIQDGVPTGLDIHFSHDGQLLKRDASRWADAVASRWGKILSKKVVDVQDVPGHLYFYACEKNGGYIYVTRPSLVPVIFHRFCVEGSLFWPEQHHYVDWAVFVLDEESEGQNWAILEFLCPSVCRWKWLQGTNMTYEQYMQYVESCAAQNELYEYLTAQKKTVENR